MLRHHRRASSSGSFRGSGFPISLLILLEVTAIVVGVLIGFWVNEWRESRNNLAVAEKALESVAAEMNYNHQRLEENYQYYTFITAQIDSMHRAEAPIREMFGYQLDGWRGAMPPMLRSSAYQMMLSTGIFKDVPFDKANDLAFVYNMQSLIEKLDDAYVVTFSQDTGFTRLETINHMFNLYAELIPSVMGIYQLLGSEMLKDYGYTLTVEPGALKDEMDRQLQYFDPAQF